jgi:hypothetical protein
MEIKETDPKNGKVCRVSLHGILFKIKIHRASLHSMFSEIKIVCESLYSAF